MCCEYGNRWNSQINVIIIIICSRPNATVNVRIRSYINSFFFHTGNECFVVMSIDFSFAVVLHQCLEKHAHYFGRVLYFINKWVRRVSFSLLHELFHSSFHSLFKSFFSPVICAHIYSYVVSFLVLIFTGAVAILHSCSCEKRLIEYAVSVVLLFVHFCLFVLLSH